MFRGFSANPVAFNVMEDSPDCNLNTASHIFHPAEREKKRKTTNEKKQSMCFLSGHAWSTSPSANVGVRTELLIFCGEFV